MNYDDYSSLFAVYDGHGGHEVAAYTAKKLPNYIKCRKDYRMGNIEQGLTEAFVEFDRTLTEQNSCQAEAELFTLKCPLNYPNYDLFVSYKFFSLDFYEIGSFSLIF